MSYWSGQGRYEELYKKLFDKLVTESGRCKTTHGELLRAISKIYYDLYNNGGCNLDVHINHLHTLFQWKDEILHKVTNKGQVVKLIGDMYLHTEDDEFYLQFDKTILEELTDAIILIVEECDEV